MREFRNPAAFRASVDQRLRAYARQFGIPVYIVRRQAALERLIARFMVIAPDHWALKGGLALETRLGLRARPSVDLDVDHALGAEAAREEFARAVARDLGDHFSFTIREVRELREDVTSLALRYSLDCSVSGAPFEPLQVDVSAAPPYRWEVERAQRPGLLSALGLGPIDVLLIPMERQVAEKLHPYTRTYGGGQASTRVRDLIDLVLIRSFGRTEATRLIDAIQRTFATRATHPIPQRVPPPPSAWRKAFVAEADRVGISPRLDEAHDLVATWLDPVLSGTAMTGWWNPETGHWESP